MQYNNTLHRTLGLILIVVAALLIVVLVLVYSQADTLDTQVNINNASPSVDSIFVSESAYSLSNDFGSGVNLVAGGTKTIHINGVVSDANGANDIDSVSARFFEDATGALCDLDNNNCYSKVACDLTSNTDTSKKYDCPIDLQYYTDATDVVGRHSDNVFKSKVNVFDKNGGEFGTISTAGSNVEINTLLAIHTPDTINYGIRTSGTYTGADDNVDFVYEQYGNDEADIQMSAGDMTCSGTGTILAEQQKWAVEDVAWDSAAAYSLSGTAADTDSSLTYRDDDGTARTDAIHMNIYIPYGVVGTCSGTNTVTAIAH